MKKTDEAKKKEVVRLYKEQNHTIKEIINLTGVLSAQMIYSILDEAKITRLKARKTARHVTINIDAKLADYIDKNAPRIFLNWFAIWLSWDIRIVNIIYSFFG